MRQYVTKRSQPFPLVMRAQDRVHIAAVAAERALQAKADVEANRDALSDTLEESDRVGLMLD